MTPTLLEHEIGTEAARASIAQSISDVLAIIDSNQLDANGDLAASIASLQTRLASDQISLAVLGEFSSGKTSFINRLLGVDLLETGLLPTTAVCTYIQYGTELSCELFFANSESIKVKTCDEILEKASVFKAETADRVVLRLPSPLLKTGLTIVDTPGVNVNIDAHEAVTRKAIQEANACIYMMDARQPGKKTTIDFVRRIHGQLNKTFFVLNRADILDSDEQAEASEFVLSAMRDECGIPEPKLTLLSSRIADSAARTEWNNRFEEFQQVIWTFMQTERDSVIYAELARLLTKTIGYAEHLIASQHRLAEEELSAHYRVTLPDANSVIESVRSQSLLLVTEDTDLVTNEFGELHKNVCRSLRQALESKIATTRTTAGLVEVGSTQIAKTFEEHAMQLQTFLSVSFEGMYTRRQTQVKATVVNLFRGVRWVDQKALLSRVGPWACMAIGAALCFGLETLVGAPLAVRVAGPFLGISAGIVVYGVFYWLKNSRSFAPPTISTTLHSSQAWAAVHSGSVYQDAITNPVQASMAPANIGRVIGSASGNPLFTIVGGSISAGIYGFRLLSDKLSGRLDKMRNEMREALKPVLEDFEVSTWKNGTEAILAGRQSVDLSLSSVLDASMQRYQSVLDRLLRPHRQMKQRLEDRRDRIRDDAKRLSSYHETVIASLHVLEHDMRGVASASTTSSDANLASWETSAGEPGAGANIKLMDLEAVAQDFTGDRGLISVWVVSLVIALALAVFSLRVTGALDSFFSQSVPAPVAGTSVSMQPGTAMPTGRVPDCLASRLAGTSPGADRDPCGANLSQRAFAGEFTTRSAFLSLFGNVDPSSVKSSVPVVDGATNVLWSVVPILDSQYSSGGEARHLLVTSSSADDGSTGCHACQSIIGAYVFVQRNGMWMPETTQNAALQFGDFGKAPAAKPVALGPSIFGFSLADEDMNQGQSTRTEQFVAPVGGRFTPVLIVTLSQDNSGNCGTSEGATCFANSSSVSFTDSGGTFSNVRVERTGTAWTVQGIVPANDSKTYVFENDHYVEQELGSPSEDTANQGVAQDNGTAFSSASSPTTSATDQINRAIMSWAHAMESNNPSEIAACYAAQVDRYFLRQNVTNSFIRDYMQTWIIEGNRRVINFVPIDVVLDTQTESFVTLHLTKHVVTTDARGSSERFTRSQLSMRRDGADWKITSERDFK